MQETDCILIIHDMCYNPYVRYDDVEGLNHYGPIDASEIAGTIYALGEGRFLSEYFRNKRDYWIFSTHRLFGDCHDYSTVLPRNMDLVESLTANSEGFELPPSAGIAGGDPRPPMALIFMPRQRLLSFDLGLLPQ